MKTIVGILLVLGLVVSFIEKSTRYTYNPSVFNRQSVQVKYDWDREPWSSTLADPVNVGSNRKWFGLKKFDVYVEIPSYAYPSRRTNVRREAITFVSPVKGATYKCINGFWTISCDGPLQYQVDPYEAEFRKRPYESWLRDVRLSTVTIYKFF